MNSIEQFIDDHSLDELIRTDIQFLGLNQESWGFERGARTERLYKDGSNTAIRDYYTYTMTNDDRAVTGLDRHIEFFDNSGAIIHTIDISKPQNVKSIRSLNREIRQGRLDYLESHAENLRDLAATLPEPAKSQYILVADSIDLMFAHYKVEVEEYISRGTMSFENAVNNETDATILNILAIAARAPDADFPNGLTVKQSIIYQLTGVKP